jgi:hypothetical protein
MTLTLNLLRTTLGSLKRDYEQSVERQSLKRFVGIHADGWTGPPKVRVGDEEFLVRLCRSALSVRAAMDEAKDQNLRVVVVATCKPEELGRDVEARVVGNRFRIADAWRAITERFGADHLSASVPRQNWLRELLLGTPDHELPPLTTSNVLDLETVQGVAFRSLGMLPASSTMRRLDLVSLLRWGGSAAASRQAETDPQQQACLRSWIEDQLGLAGAALWGSILAKHGNNAAALGLALRVLLEAKRGGGRDSKMLVVAETRLEKFLGKHVAVDALEPWAAAAEDLVRADLEARRTAEWQRTLKSADEIIAELGITALAAHSAFLTSGLRQREEDLASALEAARTGINPDLSHVERAAQRILGHALALELRQGRLEAVRMAVRLLRWLQTTPTGPGEFRSLALAYGREGSFVDWAREFLDYPAPLQPAMKELWSAVQDRRELFNQRFAEASLGQFAAPCLSPELVPLELVLDRVIAPLAKVSPVLLLVLDGMSLAVFHEILESLTHWSEIGPRLDNAEFGTRRYGVAVLPTVTEASRTSLLCGEVTTGNAATERAAFQVHPATQHGNSKPKLFHKDSLTEGRVGLTPEVSSAVGDSRGTRVVGVVLNAIDDWLGKGDQDAARWTVDRIKPLLELLQCAAAGDRVVVITSDHGHVREHGTVLAAAPDGSRHRLAGEPTTGELRVAGPRVATPGHQVVVPWTEKVRYTPPRQHGYHGGISPQEVLVPLSVFARPGIELEGYAEVLPTKPTWWEADAPSVAEMPKTKPAAAKSKPRPAAQQLPFGGMRQDTVAQLLQSKIYASQAELAGKMRVEDGRVATILGALAEHGGGMTTSALATKLELPQSRVQTIIQGLRRMLNTDGVEVIEFDAPSHTLRCDWDRLRLQFELGQERTR